MINFFLYNKAIDINELDSFIRGMLELNSIYADRVCGENYYKHSNVWLLKIIEELLKNHRQECNLICKVLGQFTDSSKEYISSKMVDEDFPNDKNGFLGIEFSENDPINENCRIINKIQAIFFRSVELLEITVNDFWNSKEKLFSNLVFCENVKEQIEMMGDSKDFLVIKETLKEVNDYLIKQNSYKLSMGKMVREFKFNISPESEQTLSQYGEERMFKIPSGEKILFSYHIKKGKVRIYVSPVNDTNRLYIGYIGKHLSTVIYN